MSNTTPDLIDHGRLEPWEEDHSTEMVGIVLVSLSVLAFIAAVRMLVWVFLQTP